jgi:transcriptional regulator with PAS, ATPase and Fis domain
MLLRLTLAIKGSDLQRHLARKFSQSDVRVDAFGHFSNHWQRIVRNCGDIIVISEELILHPLDVGISTLNGLPEQPTTVVLSDTDDSEKQAQLTAAGADVVLYAGISRKGLVEAIETTLESRRQFIHKEWFGRKGLPFPKMSDFTSNSQNMQLFIEEVQHITASQAPVLLLGETGVGKEHLAKAIHAESPRSSGPFIAVNTAALPEQLLESELFGHEQGAFTGASRSRRGAFELAHGGTLFLDEIGEMPLHLQTKLLRVLQDFEIRPVGAETPIWVDVRVIAATNQDLEKEIETKNFRRDLYYRLSVVTLTIPPLRERREDIPAMGRRFINYYRHKIGKEVTGLDETVMEALSRYDWPGNVRELMNVIERAMLLCRTGTISLSDLPNIFSSDSDNLSASRMENLIDVSGWPRKTLPQVQKEVLDQVEQLYFSMVLKETRGRVGEAAGMAGIHPRGMYNKLKRLGIRKEDFK